MSCSPLLAHLSTCSFRSSTRADLSAALTYVGEHSEYFDAATARLVDGAAQHLRLRQAVNGGSAALVALCLQEDCPLLPPSDPDRVNAAKVTHPTPSPPIR